MWRLAPYTSFCKVQTRTTMRSASCSACVSSSMLSPSMAHSLRGSTKTPFTHLGQVMHSAAQGSAAGVAPCACIRGTLYSWPVFAIGAISGFAAALARNLSAKLIPQGSAGGAVHREHCRAGLYILGKYHHLEIAPTLPFATTGPQPTDFQNPR